MADASPPKSFRNDIIINFINIEVDLISQQEKENYNVIKFPSESDLEKILKFTSKLISKDYPNAFIFVFECAKIVTFKNKFDKIKNSLTDNGRFHPLIIKIESKDGQNIFYYYDDELNEYIEVNKDQKIVNNAREIGKYLHYSMTMSSEEYEDFVLTKLEKSNDSPLILRFLWTLDYPNMFRLELRYMCAEFMNKIDLLAALGVPLEGESRILNSEYLYQTITEKGKFISILYKAIERSNKDVVNYLITHCTHLIQQLPFEHRIDISTAAFDDGKFDVLCDLLEYSDFPFPSNIKSRPVTNHKRFNQICQERIKFHDAVKNKKSNEIFDFVEKYSNLKIIFSINNKSAMCTAIDCRNFEEYYRLKSRGFEAELSENCETREFTAKDKQALSDQALRQTKINADRSISDKEKTVALLASRSLIHNRKIAKNEELKYREKIKKWFKDLYKIEICKELLDVAVQCEELKIVFDFESESVGNVDLLAEGSLGTTYTHNKLIFVAAKIKDEKREQIIKGVLIHEIGHYGMRLIYNNDENPYYKNDTINKERFSKIVEHYNKWKDDKSSNTNREDDDCDGIISTVYTLYKNIDYHLELIVRPLQILAQYDNDINKSKSLKKKYEKLFKYLEECVLTEYKKFNLRNRENVRQMNKMIGLLQQIDQENYKFVAPKEAIHNIKGNQLIIIASNVPKLLLSDIHQNLFCEDLADIKNLFVRPTICDNEMLFDNFTDIVSENKFIRIIVDCSNGIGNRFKNLLIGTNYIFVTSNEKHSKEIEKKFRNSLLTIKQQVLNYSFCDLNEESQLKLLNSSVDFQNMQINLNEMFQDIGSCIDDKTLKLLVEKSQVSINTKIDKQFEILFQPRKLIKVYSEDEHNLETEISQEDFLKETENEKCVIISDINKNGKSWFLKNVAVTLKKSIPLKWVSYIELKYFRNSFNNKVINMDFVKFIIENVLSSHSNFERNIFKKMYKNGCTCIILNGIDDLPDEYEVIKELIDSFKYNGGNQFLISSNGKFKDETQHENTVYKLADFTENNATEFIVRKWILFDMEKENISEDEFEFYIKKSNKYEDYKKYARNLSKKILNSKFDETGMPFICNLSAEHFNGKDKSCVIDSEVEKIYEQFINSKKQEYLNKQSSDSANYRNNEEIFMAIHEYHAIKNKFPTLMPIFDLIYKNVNWSEEDIIAGGLMYSKSGNVGFEHESFNEYFILTFIPKVLKNLKKLVDETGFNVFIEESIIEYLTSRKFDMTRSLLDNIFNQIPEFIETKKWYLQMIGEPYKNEDLIDCSYKIVEKVFKAPLQNESFRKTTEVIENIFGDDEIVQNVIESLREFPKAFNSFHSEADKIFSKEGRMSGITNSDPKTDFGTLSSFLDVDTDVFEPTFNDILDHCPKWEQINILKQFDKNHRHILYICVENRKTRKLKFLWEKMENHFKSNGCHDDFKAIIMKESLPFKYNLVHAAVVYAHVKEFHEIFWPLLFKTFNDQTELMNLLLKKDINGHNFTHNLLIFNYSNVICLTFEKLQVLDENNYERLLKLKTPNGNNLIHINIIQKFGLTYLKILWEIFEKSCDSPTKFLEILKKKNDEKNNVFQLVARFSSNIDIFKFMIEKLEKITTKDEIKLLLMNKDISNRNFLQSAAKQNDSLICHEYLWEIIEKYFNHEDKLSFINDCDSDKNNILQTVVSHNSEEIAKLTLEKIKQILDEDDYVEYLKKKGQNGNNLLKLSFENLKNKNVSKWTDELMRTIYSTHPHGKPINILTISHENDIFADTDQLRSMFNHHDVKNRLIVVISITGAPKKGKTFILNYLLRYLYAHYPSINCPNGPTENSIKSMNDCNEPLTGFSWNSNEESDLNSLLFWNDIFLAKNNDNQEIAIALMDTNMTILGNSDLMSFVTLFSTVQLFNLSVNLQENNFKNLIDSIEKLTKNTAGIQQKIKPFQNFIFLIRDWENINKFYIQNNNDYLENICLGGSNECKDLKHGKELIADSFEIQNCHLLTYPGRVVDTGKVNNCKYDGNFGEMDGDFKDDLFKFIRLELKLDNLNTKKLFGRNITASEFLNYIESQIEHYQLNKTFNDDLNNEELKKKIENPEIYITTKMSLNVQNDGENLEKRLAGKAKMILTFSANDKILFNNDELTKLFEHPDVKNRKVTVISINGNKKKGKSFFLNYCLRYLYSHYKSIKNPENFYANRDNWIGKGDDALEGYLWGTNAVDDINSIFIWDDAFFYTNPITGDESAIILIDVHSVNNEDLVTSKMFEFTTLISSIYINNLQGDLKKHDLLSLKTVVSSAAKIFSPSLQQQNIGKHFQKLLFLIRDWPNMDEFSTKNGFNYITDQYNHDKSKEIDSAIEYINNSYRKVDFRVLPYPGKFVATGRIKSIKYDGRWSESDDLFKIELIKFVEDLLKPENLVIKRVNGNDMTGGKIMEYVNQISYYYNAKTIEYPSISQSSANETFHNIISSLVNEYKKIMRQDLKTVLNLTDLANLHNHSKIKVYIKFENINEISKSENKIKFKQILEGKIADIYEKSKLKLEKASNTIYAKIMEVSAIIDDLEIAIVKQNLILQNAQENLDMLSHQERGIQIKKKSDLTLLLEKQKLMKMISEKDMQSYLKLELQTQVELDQINLLTELESYYL